MTQITRVMCIKSLYYYKSGCFKGNIMGDLMALTLKQSNSLMVAIELDEDASRIDYVEPTI